MTAAMAQLRAGSRCRAALVAELATPLGPMVAVATGGGVALLDFADRPGLPEAVDRLSGGAPDETADAHLAKLRDDLDGYFDGRITTFTVPVVPPAGTSFQRAAWDYLRSIPYGQTRSYGQQAAAVGAPAAARAIGRANGSNPICLLVPCHRVVGSGGRLTGFASGVDRKRWLLDHERAVLGSSPGCTRGAWSLTTGLFA